MMGGSIAVESKKGVGTTFTVEIPLELTEQVIQSKQKQPPHRDLTGIHVLMAEDNDLNAELATIILEDAGMTVTRASDGKEVVELFKNHPRDTYDLILMDIMMPNMDGYQATKAIRALGIERPDAYHFPGGRSMEQFQYSLFIIGNSHVGDIQTRNIGCNSYNIAILYPAKTFVGKFGFGDVMECLSGKGFFYTLYFADILGRRRQLPVRFGM